MRACSIHSTACCLPAARRTLSPIIIAGIRAPPARSTIRIATQTTLPLIPRAVAAGVPVLGICRGFQEMNVAFGGTLWQQLQEVPGYRDHRENKDDPLEQQYAPGARHLA